MIILTHIALLTTKSYSVDCMSLSCSAFLGRDQRQDHRSLPQNVQPPTFQPFLRQMGAAPTVPNSPPRHPAISETSRPFKSPSLALQLYSTASTMELSGHSLPLAPQATKFGKSPSSSSIGTEADFPQTNQAVPRKISEEQKQRFINLITVQNYNMKEAARIALMSYSTAKKVFTRFRKALRLKTLRKEVRTEGRPQCGYVDTIEPEGRRGSKVGVLSTIAGKEQMRRESVICVFKTDC